MPKRPLRYKLLNNYWSLKGIDDVDKRVYIIPIDERNEDYQEYLKWKAAGNEPEPADIF